MIRKLTEDECKRVEWIFKCLGRETNLNENLLEMLGSMETQYIRTKKLSDRQLDVIESVYKRYN